MKRIIAGIALLLSGELYQLIAHPEWTQALALRRLWWLWLIGTLLSIWGAASLDKRERP